MLTNRAVLVDQQGHVVTVALHFPQQCVQRLGVRHEHSWPHHPRDGRFAAAVRRAERLLDKVFQVHHADDVVDVLADHRDSGMSAAYRQGHCLTGCLVAFDPDHLGARHHHLAGWGVTQLEDRLDHPALVGSNHAPLLG